MSLRLKKFAPTLHYLAKCDKHNAKSIVKHSKPELVNCISDICHNILQNRVALSSDEKKSLAKYKNQLRRIAKRSTTKKTKRLLIQKGSFLSAILAPLLGSVLRPLAQSIFGTK